MTFNIPQLFKHPGQRVPRIIVTLLLLTLANVCLAGITLVEKPGPQTDMPAGQYRALIIGNNDYEDPTRHWPRLKTAITGAETIKQTLQQDYGFTDITLLKDATRREVLLALAALSKRVTAHDSILVYYAGHGYLDPQTNKGYWIPVDARGIDHTTYLRNSTIRDELSTIAARAKHTLLISDSCFSGSLLRSETRGIRPDTNIDRYYEKVANKKSVQIIAAGGVEYVDDNYRDSGQSPFTYFLLNELKHNNQPIITASEVSSNVEKAVANNADQVPASGVLQGAGDELGEFIFIKVKIDVDVQGIPKDQVKVHVNVAPQATQADTKQPSKTIPDSAEPKPATLPAQQQTQRQQPADEMDIPDVIHFPTL